MAALKIQGNINSVASGASSLAVTISSLPTVGNILFSAVSTRHDAITLTIDESGWTVAYFDNSSDNSSLAIAYKPSDGTETQVTWSHGSYTTGMTSIVHEYSGLDGLTPDVATVGLTSGGSSVTSQSTDTSSITTQNDCFSIACMAASTGPNVETGAAWSNGFAEVSEVDLSLNSGLSMATKELSTVQTVESTFSTTDSGSQMVTGLLIWKVAGTTPSATVSGTITNQTNERDIVEGGRTIIITLANDTWKAAGTAAIGDTADTQALIDGLTSAQSEVTGWNAEVRDKELTTAVVRTSAEIATITLTASASYDIVDNETITETVPIAALTTGASPIVATPTFQISEVGGGAGSGVILNEESQMQQLILGGTSQIVTVSIRNSTTGQGLTGLAFGTASLTAYYTRESTGTSVEIPLVTTTAGTWADGGFIEIDATNQAGKYQLGVPDALAAANETYADISLSGAADMFDTYMKVELINQIDLGSDNRSLVSADVHTSGETIAANASINTTAGKVDGVALVDVTTTNTDMRGTDSAATAASVTALNDFDPATDTVVNVTNVATNADMRGTDSANTTVPNTVVPDNATIAQNSADIATLSAKVSTLAIPKNLIYSNFDVLMLLTADNQPATGLSVTVERSIGGAGFEAATGTITEKTDGHYDFTSSADDTNGNTITWKFSATGANDSSVTFQTVR